jgi:hypothetical protein
MEPVCRPMAMKWQMPFASSPGYGSLKLQHDIAQLVKRRFAKTGQRTIIYFISDHDPSGFDLQRAWEEAMANFHAPVIDIVRIGLTTEQVRDRALDIARLWIEVKSGDTRSESYIARHGTRCWETDVLPAAFIEQALDEHIGSWLDAKKWRRREREIEQARGLL